MLNVKDYETYLGDVISSTGSNEKNIEHRVNQGIAAINQIISMLNITSLGHFFFEIALILRESVLISKLVFNSEIWYNVSDKQLEKLEQIDEMYLRRLLNVAKTAPKVGLYLECGIMPIKFIVKTRRLLYYWHILQRKKDELITRFYSAQKYSPSDGDWVYQIEKDKADIKLELSEAEIQSMSKYQFKKMVKQKIENLAIQNLESRKKQKSNKLNIKTFKPQDYIIYKNLSKAEVQTLYKIRNSMVDVKENFKSNYENMLCRLCFIFSENQQHLLDCSIIREKLKDVIEFENLNIEMAYESLERQELLAKYYTIILNARSDIISQSVGNQ